MEYWRIHISFTKYFEIYLETMKIIQFLSGLRECPFEKFSWVSLVLKMLLMFMFRPYYGAIKIYM